MSPDSAVGVAVTTLDMLIQLVFLTGAMCDLDLRASIAVNACKGAALYLCRLAHISCLWGSHLLLLAGGHQPG